MRWIPTVMLTLLVLSGSPLYSQGNTINVPADQPTIQDAINVADLGDEIVVAPGTYTENINFLGKAITVRSSGGAAVTTIDGGSSASVVTFDNEEGPDSVLEGFTITNGTRGIFCGPASPTIESNVVTANARGIEVTGVGGLPPSSPTILTNTITANNGGAPYDGAATGIYVHANGDFAESDPTILNNTISENAVGGIELRKNYYDNFYSHSFSATISGNSISDNFGRGIQVSTGGYSFTYARISNNSLCGNSGGIGSFPFLRSGVSMTILNNTISSNGSSGIFLSGGKFSGSYGLIDGNLISNNGVGIGGCGSAKVSNNTISENGTGVSLAVDASSALINNSITENTSGGVDLDTAAFFYPATPFSITNTTISGNGGVALNVYSNSLYGDPFEVTVENSIIWGNGSTISTAGSSPLAVTIRYTDIEGGYPGPGNIDADPLFVAGPLSDFYLGQIAAGQPVDSPAVDAGNPASALLVGTTRTDHAPDAGRVDMGFHHPFSAPPPPNDNCGNAISLAIPSMTSGTTIGAAIDDLTLPLCNTSVTAPGVWYTVQGTGTPMTASLCNSSYDTRINVYSGGCEDLVCVAGNDDACGLQSTVGWCSEIAVDYRILVQGFIGFLGTGDFELEVFASPLPPNDECVNAIPAAIPSSTSGTTVCASVDASFPGCGFLLDAPGVWYSAVGTGNEMTASLCNSSYDTQISVYCGDCTDAICVATNTDGCPGLGRQVTWCASLGNNYLILVHGFSGSPFGGSGNFELAVSDSGISCDPLDCGPPRPLFFRGDADGNGIFNGLLDACHVLAYQFQLGAPPPCLDAADADDNGVLNGLVDALFILQFQFEDGRPPPPPGPGTLGFPPCGPDITPDDPDPPIGGDLGCETGLNPGSCTP